MTCQSASTKLLLGVLWCAIACMGVCRAQETGNAVKSPAAETMAPYEQQIPGSNVSFEMVPIPAGTFLQGSKESAGDGESPQVKVEVPAFWIGKCEVTWAEYKLFM